MHNTPRRLYLKSLALLGATPALQTLAAPAVPEYPDVRPRTLVFPRDYGAHPDFRTEWWYMTGWLGQGVDAIGFQVTFFRSRTDHPAANPSRFAPTQLLFAHAALALPSEGKLIHAELAGRAGPAGAAFSTLDTNLHLSGWRLERQSDDRYSVVIPAKTFTLTLEAEAPQPPMLRGVDGVSSKGPAPQFASYYYSRPQLAVTAQITVKSISKSVRTRAQRFEKKGFAWFDHEWSSSFLMAGAVGWDWLGINLLDGGSIMAFRIRDAAGATVFSEWDWRDATGKSIAKSRQTSWVPIGQWRSPRSLFSYPESFLLRLGTREWTLQTLMQDQEIDARASTGGYYYEGAVQLLEQGKIVGRGYLELTGYGAPMSI